MKISINKKNFIFPILTIMPVVDTVSGIFTPVGIASINMGQVYRIVVFLVLLYSLVFRYFNKVKYVVVVSLLLILLQLALYAGNFMTILSNMIKLLTPIYIFELMYLCYRSNTENKKRFCKVLDCYSILYPIMFVLPMVFNITVVAPYDGTTGYKGAFYAVNEISFVFSVIVMYLFVKLSIEIKLINMIKLLLNCVCISMLGTKSAYLTLLLFAFAFLFSALFKAGQRFKKWIIVICFIISIIIAFSIFKEQILNIYNRWVWQRNVISTSSLDFLTSGRVRRIEEGLDIFSSNILYIVFGWGLGNSILHIGLEMDFLDLLFGVGIIGFMVIGIIYTRFLVCKCRFSFWNRLMLVTGIILCCFAGHIIYYGQSGMALGMLMSYIYLYGQKESRNKMIEVCDNGK